MAGTGGEGAVHEGSVGRGCLVADPNTGALAYFRRRPAQPAPSATSQTGPWCSPVGARLVEQLVQRGPDAISVPLRADGAGDAGRGQRQQDELLQGVPAVDA